MRKLLLFVLCSAGSLVMAESTSLTCGDMQVLFDSTQEGYITSITYKGQPYAFEYEGQPATALVGNSEIAASLYSSVTKVDNTLCACVANVVTVKGSALQFRDTFAALGDNQIEIRRQVKVISAASGDNYFNSFFSIKSPENQELTSNEYLVPGVWYKGNFDAICNTPTSIPHVDDEWFLYRDDRTPLPFVMARGKLGGVTLTLAHKDAYPATVMADNQSATSNAGYQFGSCGVHRSDTASYQCVYFPGTTKSTRQGKGVRCHPFKKNLAHSYNIYLSISETSSYPNAVKQSWGQVFDLYNPTLYEVDLKACYEGLVETMLKYYVPSRADGGEYDQPGFPFEVSLNDFLPRGIDYQMGFVGMQVSAGYYLYRYGVENKDEDIRHKGAAILEFWATKGPGPVGMPNIWYDPSKSGNGSWRYGTEHILRIMTGGMEGLLTGWCYAKKQGDEHDSWLSACKKFGDWLISEQTNSGALAFSYDRNRLVGGNHPVYNDNMLTTPNAIRYFVELYIATGEQKYKDAALAAGNYSFLMVHKKYHYCASVVDNPQVIDSESGYIAMVAFLSLYDLTKEQKWLDAAEQAATYTETWVYNFEIPVEDDRTSATSFPKDRSIVGQHLIAIGHAAADLGFAWNSFAYYHLYMLTQNQHYLRMARIAAHNTKQSMNWDQTIYPGQAKGLQLEAFPVQIPRRSGGVETTLNWNYAGHLDPMFRFKDAFGTPDLEEVEKMDWTERQQKLERYMLYQSSDYGQQITAVKDVESKKKVDSKKMLQDEQVVIVNQGNQYTIVGQKK